MVVDVGKIGFVTVSHLDYIDGTVEQVSDTAAVEMVKRGIELYRIKGLVCSSKDAEMAGKEVMKADVDAIILFLGSWIECPVAMSIIRELEHPVSYTHLTLPT